MQTTVILMKLLPLVLIIAVVIMLVSVYKKQRKNEQTGVVTAYTETPAAQMRRSFKMVIPLIIFIVIIFVIQMIRVQKPKQVQSIPQMLPPGQVQQ